VEAGHGQQLSRRRLLAVAALLSEPTILAAAAKVGINERTMRVWLSEPEFMAEFDRAATAILAATKARLSAASEKAVDTLVKNLTAEKPGDQIKAAESIMTHVGKLADQLDIMRRLEELEADCVTGPATSHPQRNGAPIH
jgi:hypothetical protein